MTKLAPPRLQQGGAKLLAGLRRTHRFEDASKGMADQWYEFIAMGKLPGQIGHLAYGVICDSDQEKGLIEYMCAAEVESFDDLPGDAGRMRLPEARYAVFDHSANVSEIGETWRAVVQDWLPQSGHADGESPAFELYGEAFDGETGEGGLEIWLPVKS